MIRALELYCGIGGFAQAIADREVCIVGAFDQSPAAIESYRLNFPDHQARQTDLEKISSWELTAPAADIWWLSPPCQPYCERGSRRDLDDPRSKSLMHIIDLLDRIPDEKLPLNIGLENVAGFTGSAAREKLLQMLHRRSYYVQERLLCPTELGVPSRRPRYYLAASRSPLNKVVQSSPTPLRPLAGYLESLDSANAPAGLMIPDDIVSRFGKGLRILDPDDPSACTTCFTAGYGRSIVHAGSYLVCGDRVRYFSPEEIVRLLHFPPLFRFPPLMPLRKRWHLAGNSLSVSAVREIVKSFPGM